MKKFIDDLSGFLGKSNQDNNLINFFVKNNFIKDEKDIKLSLYDEDGDWLDEHDLYIKNESKGLSFIFTDEAFFLENINKPLLGEILYLSTIFFYNEGVECFSKYNLGLPFDLNFSMKIHDLIDIFGNPIFCGKSDEDILLSQKWSFKHLPYTLFVSYSFSGDIRYIALSIPDAK
ncbi:hypothetical protein OZX61_02250 [Acinetobacter sp. ESL0695]|uniref:hypothetical protein n=1 Tax=Acinetobacter sp. ESL0695 TaxID=2983215 RepID=UPI0023F56153|nr:hypothetical protein [Acinetobacter sp. ESL0695]WEV49331.1 hypothetical protein OZX61_02250 [Acinetobacter sp. ESL0695]